VKTTLTAAFLVLIFSLGFAQPEILVRGLPSLTLTEFAFCATAAIFLAALVMRRVEMRFDAIYILFAIYALGLLLSAVLSDNPRLSLVKLAGEVYLLALAVLTINVVRTDAMLKKVVLVWIAASCCVALVGVLTVACFYLGVSNLITEIGLHHYGSLPPGNYPRLQSTFLRPAMLCNYMTVSLLMLLAARREGWIGRALFVAIAAAFSVTILFTVTPGIGGVLLGLALWFGLVLKENGRATASKLVIASGALAAAAFLVVSAFTVFAAPASPFTFSIGGVRIDATQRLLTWYGAVQTFLEHPIFGKGLGLAVAEVFYIPPSGQQQLLVDAHNALLNVAGQAGLFGAIPLVLICIAVVRRTLPFRLAPGNSLHIALGIAFISAFIIQGLVGSFENARHLWVLIGLIIASSHIARRAD
jgi:putative inorganic carbon (hco3(-)) transporter